MAKAISSIQNKYDFPQFIVKGFKRTEGQLIRLQLFKTLLVITKQQNFIKVQIGGLTDLLFKFLDGSVCGMSS